MIKNIVKKILGFFPSGRKVFYGRFLYKKCQEKEKKEIEFLKEHWDSLWVEKHGRGKASQIASLLNKIDIVPANNNAFFYSIDYFKTLQNKNHSLNNYTVNYKNIIMGSLREKYIYLSKVENNFAHNEKIIIEALYGYYKRMCSSAEIIGKYGESLKAIESLFERPAHTFYEGLQRVLFFNQFLWQTGHNLNGLGRLDLLLISLYRNDIADGRLTVAGAKTHVRDFLLTLHEGYWFKSNELRGDTGQIIILGGVNMDDTYNCNELTYLFIEVLMELRLPDPKVLLRCSSKMPDKLLRLGLKSISTGIGTPILSNDDTIIQALITCGYDNEDAYNYITAACWEPLILDCSCDLSNAATLNFAEPFVKMLNSNEIENVMSIEEILNTYHKYLKSYIVKILFPISKLKLELEPVISLLSDSAMEKMEDITQGGAKYYNIGLTSVGLGTVVNSILNIQDIVFEEKKYSMAEFNKLRKSDFVQNQDLRQMLKNRKPCFGNDDKEVLNLTKQIIDMVSKEFGKYKTMYGGRFKFGLSSPNYINVGKRTESTFDGRKARESFNVHISSSTPISTTELLCFAMELDYKDNRINGNVVDFIVSPEALKKNFEKYILLLKSAIEGGIFQLQINVVSSKTLIAARKDPELFPNLVVRVWGFSAYFIDLPDEYKELLIMRAIESEKVA